LEALRLYSSDLETEVSGWLKENNKAFQFKVELEGFLFDFFVPELKLLISCDSVHDHSERYWEDGDKLAVAQRNGFHWKKIMESDDLKLPNLEF